ncbi:MAG: cobalamin-binding protein [Acidobacteriota bacterium]
MFRHLSKLLITACLLLAGACARPATDQGILSPRREFSDGLGRRVNVAFPPQRIISLAPSVTEALFALGLDDRITAVTSYCDYPAAALQKEKVGDTLHLNLERIISLRPDLVVISTASQLENLTRRLDELAIPVYVVSPRSVTEVASSLRGLGAATGTEARAETVASEMERRIGEVQKRLEDVTRPKVLYVLQTSPLITVGGKTFINDLIVLAGGVSISAAQTADYPQFSRETAVASKPDVIIAPASHGTEIVKEESLKHDFAGTPAIARGRIVRVDPDFVDRPGPRLIDGLEQLARGLHPEKMR